MYTTSDRRLKPRISCDYPAIVEWSDSNGSKYCEHGTVVNLGAGGLFVIIAHNIEPVAKLSITAYLSDVDEDSPILLVSGMAIRVEPQSDGKYGIAVKFQNYRFR